MATTVLQGRRFKDHSFYLRCGPYVFFCDCDATTASIEDEDTIEEVRPRRVLKRQPSQHAVTLGRSLSKHVPTGESEGVVDRLRRGTSRLNVLEATIDHLDERDEENAEGDLLGIDEVEEVQAFKAAVSAGRYLSAAAELHRLEAAGLDSHHLESLLEPVIVERVRRIDDKYHYSLGMLAKPVEDLAIHEIDAEQKLEWGVELKNGIMRSILRVEEPDTDIVKAFAGMQERDMHKEFNKGLTDIQTLGVSCPHDSFWRTFSYSSTTKTENDNVSTISGLDALDEKNEALWGAQYTLAETTATVNGISIPPAKPGHQRTDYAFHAWKLSPLRKSSDMAKGFRMAHFIEVKLPAVARHILEWIPSAVIRGLARSRVTQFPISFRHFVEESTALNQRLKDSPRAEFYRELRQRITANQKNTSQEPAILPAV